MHRNGCIDSRGGSEHLLANGGTITMSKVPLLFNNLRKMQIFSALSDAEMGEIIGKIKVKHYRKDEVILWEGDTNSYMYLVVAGRVKVVQITEDGKEIISAIHAAGDSFGELSLIDGKTSPAEVVAIEKTSAAIISRENFFSIIYSHKKVLDNLIQMFCMRLRDSWEREEMVNYKKSEQRLAMLFQKFSASDGEPVAEGTLLNIRLTHQIMASMTGLSRETVTRTIDALKKEKSIKIRTGDRKVILLPDFLNLSLVA
jgi:CRP/FNR family transcriptional regulator, cyclic AMP receptor protein